MLLLILLTLATSRGIAGFVRWINSVNILIGAKNHSSTDEDGLHVSSGRIIELYVWTSIKSQEMIEFESPSSFS